MGITIRTNSSNNGVDIHTTGRGSGVEINTDGYSETDDARLAPYIDPTTLTWWQYDRDTRQFTDTGVSPFGVKGETGETGEKGPAGLKGDPGTGVYVADISETDVDGGENVVLFSDGSQMSVRNGKTGMRGLPGPKGDRGDPGPKGADGDISRDELNLALEQLLETVEGMISALSDLLGTLAYQSSASGTFTPDGSISMDAYTPAGSVSAPEVTVTKSTESVVPFGSAGSLPSLSASLDTNGVLEISLNPGTLPSAGESVTVLTDASASASAPSFTGTEATLTGSFAGTEGTVNVS